MHQHKQLFDHCVIAIFVCIKVQRWCLPSTMAWPPGVFTPPICSSNRRLRRTTRLISRQQIRASRTNSRSVKPTAGPLSHAHFSLWQLCQAGYVFNGAYLFTIIQLGQGFNDIFRKCWSCDTQSKTPQWQTKGRNDLKKNVNYSVGGKKATWENPPGPTARVSTRLTSCRIKTTRQIWRSKDLRGFDPRASKDQDQWALKIKRPAVLGCNEEVDNINGGLVVLGTSHKMCAHGLLGGGGGVLRVLL